jgi:hypothetical protein
MSVSITTQPAANSLNAAYRPIIITGSGSGNPVAYCDIYFGGVYYKTISKTQAPYDFDIQNAAKEYLKKYLAPNGGTSFYVAAPIITDCYVKLRGSIIDTITGFTVPDAPIPIQGTSGTAPTSGGGTQSNTFYILNSALQNEDNQNLASHMNGYKQGSWNSATYPLTHRPDGYPVSKTASDFFPIVSDSAPSSITMHYKLKSTGLWNSTSGGGSVCVVPTISGSLGNGTAGAAYSSSVSVSGTAPFTLSGITKPSWMTLAVSGSSVVASGTPSGAETDTVAFTVTNACGSDTHSQSINIGAACVPVSTNFTPSFPDGQVGEVYSYSFGLSGDTPYSLTNIVKPSWMTVAISGTDIVLSGTPIAEGTSITVSFTINNACGTVDESQTIDVAPAATGTIFGDTTFNGGDSLNESETANITGAEPGATITIEMDNYSNTNTGRLQVNEVADAGLGMTWNLTADGSGNATLNADIFGVAGHPGSVIMGHFIITAVSAGTIGTNNSYQISKVF